MKQLILLMKTKLAELINFLAVPVKKHNQDTF